MLPRASHAKDLLYQFNVYIKHNFPPSFQTRTRQGLSTAVQSKPVKSSRTSVFGRTKISQLQRAHPRCDVLRICNIKSNNNMRIPSSHSIVSESCIEKLHHRNTFLRKLGTWYLNTFDYGYMTTLSRDFNPQILPLPGGVNGTCRSCFLFSRCGVYYRDWSSSPWKDDNFFFFVSRWSSK